jgi:H+/Cl- antiporter ClcA
MRGARRTHPVATFPVVWFDVSPTLAVAVGAAAGMAAMTGLLLTAMLFSALLVGRQGLDAVPAAVLAAAAVFVSNIPQGIAGTAALREAGYADRRILRR